MLVYNIGISAVQANQAALQTISNNIANANTQGYHRQQITLAQTNPIVQNHLQFGTGVTVASIQRVVDSAADHALTLNLSQSGDAQARLQALQSIEGLLTPSSGSLTSAVSDFFDSVEKLQTSPADNTLRRDVLSASQAVAQQITTLNSGLDQLQQANFNVVNDTVEQINSLTSQIAAVNKQIRLLQTADSQPSALLDQRDQLVQDLGKLVDIDPSSLTNANSAVVAAGGWLVVGDAPQQLSVARQGDGTLQINIGTSGGPVEPVAGKLGGLLTVANEIIPNVRDAVQEWTSAFVSGVNSIQATGLGLNGPAAFVNGSYSVSNPQVPLAQAKTLFPVGQGALSITLTNSATGLRTTQEVAINPDQDSLQDVIDRINALPNISASLTSTGQVRMAAAQGYAIDFAGRLDSQVDTSAISGTAVPQLSGSYTGTGNARWTVTADSSGQIGSTDGLNLRVTDNATGSVVAIVSVGNGYAANQPIEIADGVSISLNSGTLNAGDSFAVNAISDPDSGGFLTALGVGGLFQTSDLRTITVDKSIAQNLSLLAASRTGNSGDATQLDRLIQFRTAPLLSSGTETIEDRLASLTSNSGLDVNSTQSTIDQLQTQYNQLRDQQDSVSGVDSNEELLAMLQYQRAFQANARFLTTINSALDDLLGIIK